VGDVRFSCKNGDELGNFLGSFPETVRRLDRSEHRFVANGEFRGERGIKLRWGEKGNIMWPTSGWLVAGAFNVDGGEKRGIYLMRERP